MLIVHKFNFLHFFTTCTCSYRVFYRVFFFCTVLQLFALVLCFGDQFLSPGSSLATDFFGVVPLWRVAQENFSSPGEAQQIVTSITSFSFIATFMAVYQYLSHLSGITVKLQKTSLDIIKAHELVNEVNAVYKEERRDVDAGFSKIFQQSIRLAERVGAEVSMPRIARLQ